MRPPLLARALLAAVAGAAEAECVAGDLEEEFAGLSAHLGRSAINRWYVSQVLRSLLPLLRLRMRSGELSAVLLGPVLGAAVPLLLMDRLWRLVYSQIPLKDGVDRAPEFLAVNLLALSVSAAISGSLTRSMRQASVRALVASAAAGAALAASAGSTPAAYAVLVLLVAPAGSMFGSMLRRFT
jgi:hypothetical protein